MMEPHNSPDEGACTLYGETVSRRTLPRNFDQRDINLFNHELEKTIPRTRLLQLKDVRVTSEGVLFKRFRLLPESFAFAHHLKQWKWRSRLKFFVRNYVRRRSRDLARDALWVTDEWSTGYFHWLADVLSRLYVMRDRLEPFVLLLPLDYASRDFVQSSLRAFGVGEVEFIGQDEVVRCPRLFLPTHTAPSGHYNHEIIHGVRRLLLDAYGEAREHGAYERVYISRSRAPKRKIANEDAVLGILAEFEFQTIYAEDLSFEEQVKIFSRVRCLVSNHGAGLTNMLFMPAGNVLELRHQTDCINNCYFTLSSALNLGYFYQTCVPENPAQDPHAADLVVDVNTLRANLALMLEVELPGQVD